MTAYEKYQLRLNNAGGSVRQEKINQTRHFINRVFKDDPNYYVVPIDGISREVRIYDTNSRADDSRYKKIQFLDFDYIPSLGDYVIFKDRWWLITNTDDCDEIQNTGIISECNFLCRWLNEKGQEIERWIIFNDRTRYTGELENKNLVVGEMYTHIIFPKDDETVKISRNRRFIIDDYDHAQIDVPVVFKISGTNRVEKSRLGNKCLYKMTVAEDTFNRVTDNREKMICNYTPVEYTLNVIVPQSPLELEVGQSVQIVYDAQINREQITEGITFESSDESVLTVDENGLITAVALGSGVYTKVLFYILGEVVAEQTIEVNVVDTAVEGNYIAQISGNPFVRIGSTRAMTVEFFDNLGNPITDTPIWDVVDLLTGLPPTYIIFENTGIANQIRLRCQNNLGLVGNLFTLRVEGQDYGAISKIEMTVESLV